MDTYTIYEIIGYLASVLIAVSLMMSAIIKLRIINLIGAALFSMYGILIGALPVAAMNGFIVLINIYYLRKYLSDKEYFRLLRVNGEGEYIRAFIDFYHDEIMKYQPDFNPVLSPDDVCIFVLRNMVPAGLLVTRPAGNQKGTHTVELDFVIPNYRDFKVGKYLFHDRRDYLREQGIQKMIAFGTTPAHRKYLERAGFHQVENRETQFEWSL